MLPGINRETPGYACQDFFNFAIQEALKPEVGRVVLCCFWEAYFADVGRFPDGKATEVYHVNDPDKKPLQLASPHAAQSFRELGETVAKLTGAGKEVVIILSHPSSSRWNPRTWSTRLPWQFQQASQEAHTISRSEFESHAKALQEKLVASVLSNGGKVIDPLPYFEEEGSFHGRRADGEFYYRDGNHLRPFYAVERATFLDPLIQWPGKQP